MFNNEQHNLETELKNSPIIQEKVKNGNIYSQNLYAALCNNQFQKHEIMSILTDELWSCSWRYAGGIVAQIKGEGDYMDYYCSGIGQLHDGVAFPENATEEDRQYIMDSRKFVSESTVTDEIREDLYNLGWTVVPYEDE